MAIAFRRRQRASADVHLERWQDQGWGRQRCVARAPHFRERSFADAVMNMHVARSLFGDAALPCRRLAVGQLIAMADKESRALR